MQTTRQRMRNCRQDCGHRTPRDATPTSPVMLLNFQHHKTCCSFHRFVLGGRHTTHVFSSTMIGDTCGRFRVAVLDCIELPGRLHLSDHDIDVTFPNHKTVLIQICHGTTPSSQTIGDPRDLFGTILFENIGLPFVLSHGHYYPDGTATPTAIVTGATLQPLGPSILHFSEGSWKLVIEYFDCDETYTSRAKLCSWQNQNLTRPHDGEMPLVLHVVVDFKGRVSTRTVRREW